MKQRRIHSGVPLMLFGLLGAASPAVAQTPDGDVWQVVIQVSSGDEGTHKTAMSNAKNLIATYGDQVRVVLVAYGQGLSLLDEASPQADNIAELTSGGVEFDACNNTIKKWTEQGHAPSLLPGVVVVDTGVGRVVELQRQGYAYVRP